ncbi:DUF559 domain-containing protein [Cohnella endophytica]|uniref:DUF559 domain-containing protein n=1 Tax=Cohnella endophytica TaxID=2419778 RepID=A0A494XGQ6_9BACL|nr:DUF559 domain-containing protein [Cohnella endophytica]RKP47264.1 DUF559 domain-containing protein [Cohnella endophytica]
MEFEQAYDAFVEYHRKRRKGERLRRLNEGHRHAEKMLLEKVWWPAFRNFDGLHPEYEVSDFKDGNRFLDFAFLEANLRLDIEVDGHRSHAKDISRDKFSDHLMRQNHLTLDGWKIIRFSYDDIAEKPRMCQQLLLQFMGRWATNKLSRPIYELRAEERDILRIGLRDSTGKLTVTEICLRLGIGDKKARKHLCALVAAGLIAPSRNNAQRIRSYRLTAAADIDLLGI